LLLLKRVSLTWLNISYLREMFLALEELEKPIMSELQEFQELRLSTDHRNFKNLMLVLNAVFLISEKLETITFLSLSNVKILRLAQLCSEVPPRMFSTRWKGTYMIALEYQKIFILIQDLFLEEVHQKCRFLLV